MKKITLVITEELFNNLGLQNGSDEVAVATAIKNMVSENQRMGAEVTKLTNANTTLQNKVNGFENADKGEQVKKLLDEAQKEGAATITNEQRTVFENTFKDNPEGLKTVLSTFKPIVNVTDHITDKGNEARGEVLNKMDWDALDKAGHLVELKNNFPSIFQNKYIAQFGQDKWDAQYGGK